MTPKEKNDLLHDFINFGEGETLDGQYVKGLYYEEECVENYCNKKLEEQAKQIIELIYAHLTDWKVEEITCKCENCYETILNLTERDKLIKSIKQKYCGEKE